MSLPVVDPYTFAAQAGPIALSELDSNFAELAAALNDVGTYNQYFQDTSGAANTVTVTVAAPQTFAYVTGIGLSVKIANTNTLAAVNIDVNALGNQLITNPDGSALAVGQLDAGGIYSLVYDGAKFQLQSALGFSPADVARLDQTNGFTVSQDIIGNTSVLQMKNSAPTDYFAIGTVMGWTGAGADNTDAALGALGTMNFYTNNSIVSKFGLGFTGGREVRVAGDATFLNIANTALQSVLQISNVFGYLTTGANVLDAAIAAVAVLNLYDSNAVTPSLTLNGGALSLPLIASNAAAPAAGGGGALPATPFSYVTVTIAGRVSRIPYY
jgi:hypothetical protein